MGKKKKEKGNTLDKIMGMQSAMSDSRRLQGKCVGFFNE